MATASLTINNLADLQERLGDVPLNRIRFRPAPGTATMQDVIDVNERGGIACELVEGVLVEKAVGLRESRLAGFLLGILNAFVIPRNVGFVTGEAGMMELMAGLVRIPDVAFMNWDRLSGAPFPTAPAPRLTPDLAIEVLSRSNTPREMVVKRQDYFTSGVALYWEIDPVGRTVDVYTSVTDVENLIVGDILDGGAVLPGFSLPLGDLFGELDRR